MLVDPETTIQRMMLIFYGLINVGAFFALATTYSEKYVGYWLAFLLPGILYFLLPILLYFWYNKTIKKAPNRGAYDKFYAIIWIAIKKNGWRVGRKGFWDPARPSVMRAQGITTYKGQPIPWDDGLVDDVHRTFSACQIFLYFIIYNLNDGGIGSVGSAQAAAMTTNGAPNDLLRTSTPLPSSLLFRSSPTSSTRSSIASISNSAASHALPSASPSHGFPESTARSSSTTSTRPPPAATTPRPAATTASFRPSTFGCKSPTSPSVRCPNASAMSPPTSSHTPAPQRT